VIWGRKGRDEQDRSTAQATAEEVDHYCSPAAVSIHGSSIHQEY